MWPRLRTGEADPQVPSLVLGTVFGLLTFFFWGVFLLVNGGSASAFLIGLELAFAFGAAVGIAGFLLGEEKLAHLFGILWGTDTEFNEKLNDSLYSVAYGIPTWLVSLFLVLAIVGSCGYLLLTQL